jgi:hypothetical protein
MDALGSPWFPHTAVLVLVLHAEQFGAAVLAGRMDGFFRTLPEERT